MVEEDIIIEKPSSLFGMRHLQCVLLFLGMVIAYSMRVNMSMAIVAMTDSTQNNSFDWSLQTQSLVLSSFFWGYVILQIPGGELAARFGGKVLITICVGVNSVITLLMPLGSYYGGWQVVCAFRMLQGLSQGFIHPITHHLIGKWVPLEEKSRLGTLIYSGSLFGMRHLQCVLLFLGMVIAYSMRVNMSMAIVAMTDSTQNNSFDWSLQTQSLVLSSFFWGYVILQIPGGELAARFGGKVLITICVGVNSVITLLMPLGSYYGGWQVVCAFRMLQGLSQGFIHPITHHLIGKWVPLEEKSRLGTLIYSGGQLGTAIQLMAAGFIANSWGWPVIFYSSGVIGIIWTAIYVFLGANSPRSSKLIKEVERNYIENSLGHIGKDQKKMPTPWRIIATSMPCIALVIAHCGQNWGFWTLMTEIPSYMNQVLQVDIKSNGVLSALPYIAMYVLSFPVGYASDYMLNKKWLTITACRKLFNSLGHFGPGLALIGLSYVPSGQVVLAVTLLTIVVGLNSGQYLVHIDMAPNFAGTLMGITNGISNGISILAPIAAGAIIQDETDPSEWRKVFYLSSGIYIACNIFFLIFGTSEKQPWNEASVTTDEEKNDTKTKF